MFHANLKTLLPALVVATAFSAAPAAQAGERSLSDEGQIVIRQTIPNPRAVKRAPLTSDQLSTTSTRLIDARRGFRPYSSVFNGGVSSRQRVIVGFDDHFGISRPENRPFSYSQRTPRTGVSQFRSTATSKTTRTTTYQSTSRRADVGLIIVAQNTSVTKVHAPELNLRVHSDRSAVPKTSGAVLIRADGTVIQIGD